MQQDDEAARERLKAETKATYVAAVQHLFALLALPDSEKSALRKEERGAQ